MPPARKRAPAKAKPEPAEQGALEAPAVEAAPEEAVEAEPAGAASPEPPAKAKAAKNVDLPCTICFRDGWPDGVTARGCEHGSWTRT